MQSSKINKGEEIKKIKSILKDKGSENDAQRGPLVEGFNLNF